jgi:hypothetical protein
MVQKYNSTIQTKHGCIDCAEGNNKPIYARKRCTYHYQLFALKARQDKVRVGKQPQNYLWEFYQRCIGQLQMRCAECGDRIYLNGKDDHWHVCHFLPKGIFESIKDDDNNWWEGCRDCHRLFDYYLETADERITQMNIFKTFIEKLKILKPKIKEHRRFNNLPNFILHLL